MLTAVFVVAMFMAVPLSVTFDSDADYGSGEAGYTVEFTEKASAAELEDIDTSVLEIAGDVAENIAESIGFSVWDMEVTAGTMETFTYKGSMGQKAGSGKLTAISSKDVDATKLSVTFTADSDSPLFSGTEYTTPKQKETMDAIIAYFGTSTVHAGDKLVITADSVRSVSSERQDYEYGSRNDSQCYETSHIDTYGQLMDTKAVITYKPVSGAEKSITIDLDVQSLSEVDVTYNYAKDLKDVTPGEMVNITIKGVPKTLSYSFKVTVGDTDYRIDDIESDDGESSASVPVYPRDKTSIAVEPTFKVFCDTVKGSENVTVEVGYDKAESSYDSAVDDISTTSKKTNLVPIIIGVVVAVVVIGGIAAFVIVKKKA